MVGAIGLGVLVVTVEAVRTAPVRGAVRAYSALISAVNRNDLEGVRAGCSSRYLSTHSLEIAEEGGVVGMPRAIHRNFRAWRRGNAVWICPGNRVGLVFQFVPEGEGWKFDGLVGLLRPGNLFVPVTTIPGGPPVLEGSEDAVSRAGGGL